MFCPKCGRINPDEEELCKGCGAQLHEETEKPLKKSKKGLKGIIIAFAVILIIAILAALFVTSCEKEAFLQFNKMYGANVQAVICTEV